MVHFRRGVAGFAVAYVLEFKIQQVRRILWFSKTKYGTFVVIDEFQLYGFESCFRYTSEEYWSLVA